jgi:HK97 family phage major capsid protein
MLDENQLKTLIKSCLGEILEQQKPVFSPNIEETITALVKSGIVHTPKPEPKHEVGHLASRYIRAIGGSKVVSRSGTPISPVEYAAKIYGPEDVITKAMAATTFADGGALIPPDISSDIIELLRPASVVRSMNPMLADLPRGQLPIPKVTGGAQFSWIGENQNLGSTALTAGNVVLVAKKGGATLPISNDLLRRADARSDGIIRDDLVAAIGQGTDLAYIRGNGTLYSPKGLRYWAPAANVFGSAGQTLDNVSTDLEALMLRLFAANVRMIRPGWLMAPRAALHLMFLRDGNGNYVYHDEMMMGRLNGYPFKMTTQIPINLGGGSNESEVYFADFADVVIGDALTIAVEVSTEAAYYDSGTGQVVSAWSLDQSVLRAIVETDLVVRHLESVAVLTGVIWGT